MVGKQSGAVGRAMNQAVQMVIDSILGIQPGSAEAGTVKDIVDMFSNVWTFLGDLNPTSPSFNPVAAIESFIQTMLSPTNLMAMLVPSGSMSAGVTGVIPLENLALDLIEGVIGGAQGVIDAILATVGFPAGSGTTTNVNQYFTDFLSMFSNPALTSGTFNPITAVETFITDLIQPTNLLAVLVPNASTSGGVTGFIPMENLALDLIAGVVGGAQQLVDAILGTVGIPAGTGTTQQVNIFFGQMMGMLANPNLLSSTFSPVTAVENFITTMITPTGLLAPLENGLLSVLNIPSLDTSKITSGTFGLSFLPSVQQTWNSIVGAMGGSSSGNVLADVENALLNIPGVNIVSTLLASVIPGLDATKIISGIFGTGLIPGLPASQITSGTFLAGLIPGLDATKIISGIFGTGLIPSLPASQITSGTFLSTLIPGLDATKIISGQFPQSMLNITSIAASLITGVLGATNIPGLDATKIISGIFGTGLIPSLPAGQITSGVFGAGLIPGLDATKIISGILSLAQIPGLPASQTTSGVFTTGLIPNITKAMSTDMQSIIDSIFQSSFGGSSTGNTLGSVKTSLTSIPGVNIISSLLASVIPGLDATKIISGIFTVPQIPALPAGQITSGVFGAGLIPGLDATKIISGVFPQSMVNITSIAASLVTGVLGATNIPGLDATKIISGVLSTGLIPGLDASQITSGLLPQWLMPVVPVGSVGQTTPNLLSNPSFNTAVSLSGDATWTWDSGTSHTADGSGSAKAIPNGNTHQLLSDPPIPVAANQQLSCSVWTQWSAFTGSGPAFQLSVNAYLAGNPVGATVLQTITSPAASGAWTQLSGTYTVPSSGVDAIRLGLSVLAGATGGSVWFDDGSVTKVQLLAQSWMAGLTGDINNLYTGVNASALQTDLISLVNNLGLGSFSSVSGGLSNITSRLTNLASGGTFDASQLINVPNIPGGIPHSQVVGILGPPGIGDSAQALADAVVQGITGVTSAGHSLASLAGANANLSTFLGYVPGGMAPSGSVAGIGVFNNNAIAQRAVTKPSYVGLDPSGDATIPFSSLAGPTMPTIPVTSAASVIGMIGTPDAGIKEAINWIGSSTGTITGLFINIYSVNTSTGVLTLLYASGDIHGSVSSALATNYLNLPSANYITSAQGNWYAVEMALTGTGTYNIAGVPHNAPTNTSVYPRQLGATRNTSGGATAPSSIASPIYTANVPYLTLTGSAGVSQLPPVLTPYTSAGSFTYNIPAWANHFDVIVLGGGGGGFLGSTTLGINGAGGGAGSWAAVTITRGINFTTATTIAVTVGAGGGQSSAGSASSASATGWAGISAAAGAGGNTWATGAACNGASPGNEVFGGNTYYGGAVQTSPGVGSGPNGSSPGGGGAGGGYLDQGGGSGAAGAVFILAYQ